ncbi:MAG TPA: hypothetical protein VM243_15170, partial [Phycisphaerae bacterium]|nr:hypothetical protein [Phycisphaerae bacterium]
MAKKNETTAFKKIAAEGKIKAYTRVEGGGVKVALKDLLFADDHRALLDRLMDEETQVRVTIEVVDPTFEQAAEAD